MAVEYGMPRADGQAVNLRPPLPELLPDRGRAPARILPLGADDRLFDDERQLIGVAVPPSAAVGQPCRVDVEPSVCQTEWTSARIGRTSAG
jgi:hypothetical protein